MSKIDGFMKKFGMSSEAITKDSSYLQVIGGGKAGVNSATLVDAGQEQPLLKNLDSYAEGFQIHPFVYDAVMTIAANAMNVPLEVVEAPDFNQPLEKRVVVGEDGKKRKLKPLSKVRRKDYWNRLERRPEFRSQSAYHDILKMVGAEVIADHPLPMLVDTPPPVNHSMNLIKQTFIHLETMGNAYWEIVWANNGRSEIEYFYPINPQYVFIVPSTAPDQLVSGYLVKHPNGTVALEREDVIHFKYEHNSNDYYGLSPISSFLIDLQTDVNAAIWNDAMIKNYAIPEGLLSFKGPVDQTTIDRFLDEWEQAHKGPANTRRLAAVDNGAVYTALSLGPKDMDFLAGREWTRDTIAGVFGVPPIFLKDFSDASYNNARVQVQQFYWTTMMPKLKLIENVLTAFLRNAENSTERTKARYNFSAVEALQENMVERAEAGLKMRQVGIPDRIIYETLFPFLAVPDDEFIDTRWRPFNLVPVDATPVSGEAIGTAIPNTGEEDE